MPFRRAKWYRGAIISLLSLTAILIAAVEQPSARAWSGDPTVNTPVCTNTSDQSWNSLRSNMVNDGSGGAIITWQDYRNGNWDVYARRVDSTGTPLWGADGIAVCTAAYDQQNPTITADGSGGAIIAWHDYRSGTNWDIYAQKVNSDGTTWSTADGVPLCVDTGAQQYPCITGDGSGGAIVAWKDSRLSGIFARKVDSGGTARWTYNGVRICGASLAQENPAIVSDGSGGAIIAWQDYRSSNWDIYARKINSDASMWATVDGVAICTATGTQQNPSLTSDGSGGAIIAWQDERGGTRDIYAQSINSSGTVRWSGNGAAICTAAGAQEYPALENDGSSGAIITWQDFRNSNLDIYARRIDSTGTPLWSADGNAICSLSGNQQSPALVSDGSGGAIIAWQDDRNGNADIYAQKVASSGTAAWNAGGGAISTQTSSQQFPSLATDGYGGAIIAWQDQRNGNRDVYAQRVKGTGILPALAVVEEVTPTWGYRGQSVSGLTITGDFFTGATSVSFGAGVNVDNFTVTSSTSITADITIDAAATLGARDVSVTNSEGAGTPTGAFTVYAPPLSAGFSADRTAVVVGQTVQFTDGSSGGETPFTYQWDFGDGETSAVQSPSHTYSSAGGKTVTLTVTDSAASTDTDNRTDYINVSASPNADFSADRTAVIVGQTVQFTDSSSGGAGSLTYQWDFGDGETGTAQSPSHSYSSAGGKTVTLTVTDSATNTDSEIKAGYVSVSSALWAGFSAYDTAVLAGESIAFTNSSGGGVAPLSYQWDFDGDGFWDSTAQSPTYAYSNSGTYTVVLRVSDSATNSATESKVDYISVEGSCDSVASAAGTGSVEICTSAGALESPTAVAEGSVSSDGKPDLLFSHGLFAFDVTGLSPGDDVTVTITLPSAVPTTAQYWKHGPTPSDNNPHWYQIAMGDNDGDNVITITLTDGGLGDDDLSANGTIIDQGGPGWPRPPEPRIAPAFPSIYAGITVALGAGVVAYLIRRRLTNP